MDPSKVIIARLVLGYLRAEKCVSAYKEFLRTCNYLHDKCLKNGRYPTRFVGLTLKDILSEYFQMYKIIQGQLEFTNFYNECDPKSTLVEQLLYLVNKVPSSRASTPCPRSPPDSNLGETSPSHGDQNSDVETTPVHTLPGNIRCTSEDSYLNKTPRRRLQSKFNKSNTVSTISTADREDMSEVLAQTLLENKEFHEKIAQTINKVAEKQYRVSAELDKTIKTVVKETEEDPIFDKILEEIIESTTMVDTTKGIEISSTSSSIAKNTNEPTVNKSKRTHIQSEAIENEDLDCRSYLDSKKVEEQNNEAVRSIVANSKMAANMPLNNNETCANNEVIVFDGSLDKYLISNTCNSSVQTQPVQNPVYINTNGNLVMVPSIATNIAPTVHIDTSKQFYVFNKQPTIGWNVPTIKTPNIITEQDILAMPTVIVTDEKQNKITATQSVLQTPVVPTIKASTLPTIVPKPTIEIPAEYFPLCSGQQQPQRNIKKVMYPKTTEKQQFTETAVNTNPPVVKEMGSTAVPNNAKSLPSDLLSESPQESQTKEHKSELIKEETQAKTPPPPEPIQKITPKSASHIRNLDFSTPPKITSTHKKVMKTSQGNKSPLFVHKKQAAKILFNSRTIADNDNKSKDTSKGKNDVKKKNRPSAYAWDADLRAIITPEEDVKRKIPEKKRKTPVKRVKKIKKPVKRAKQQLNTTEHDAALLEAALQSPIKTEKDYLKTTAVKVESEEGDGIKETACLPESEQRKSGSDNDTNNTEHCTKNVSVGKQQNKDITEDNSNKMVLSPSKLNANKRNLVNTNSVKTQVPREETENGDVSEKNKYLTPEMTIENVVYPVKANRNLMPMLATPLKNEQLPKTPGIQTPANHTADSNLSMGCSIFTPFSKILEENLKGVDITSFPTPSIPITPNFPPLTPSVDLISPYSNRPTDYSTSSSYYQPSDNEQNKSLEANVIELEKKPVKILSDVIVKEEVSSSSKMNKVVDKNNQNSSTQPAAVNEHLNIFNKNVIGKKNLNLMKNDMPSNSSSSDDTTSESSSEDDNYSDMWQEKESNDTVICKNKTAETPKRTYSLRNRTTTLNNKESSKKPIKAKESKINTKSNTKDTKVNSRQSKMTSKQVGKLEEKTTPKDEILEKEIITKERIVNTKSIERGTVVHKVLKELEEIRLRTINKFKGVEKITTKKSSTKLPARHTNGKFMKIKPLSNVTTSKRRRRKSESPKKTTKIPGISKDSLKSAKNLEDNNLSLHLSISEDEDEKPDTLLKAKDSAVNIEKTDKSASDVEAQNLIEGLKERGIHLMHNKSSPNKKINEASTQFKTENKEVEIIENTDLSNCLSSVNTDSSKVLETSSFETTKSELSTTELKSELRDTYDTQLFEEETVRVVFDESKEITKTLEDYDTKVLAKTLIGKVFIEEIDKEIDIPLVFSPLYTLLDIPPTDKLEVRSHKADLQKYEEANDKVVQSEKICNRKESVEETNLIGEESRLIKDVTDPTPCEETVKSDDDLMNYAIIGSVREQTPESSDSPKSTRKRKLRSEENSHTEKKCKTLLSQLNLETFLDNIHGEN